MNAIPILDTTTIGNREIRLDRPPAGLVTDPRLALVLGDPGLTGQVVYTATDMLIECRATPTPGGDYLLMFPTNTKEKPKGNCHYGGKKEKTNDMVAFRSRDQGQTWEGPKIAFDIDYNQHGFIPLIPRGSRRIYAFGTQPVWNEFSTERGQGENAPIGYRYSDDDGHHWSEVRLIRPQNDPGFRAMSVMRMCETDNGTWLLGAHEGDWTYRPLMTRQYLLRSEDQGQTWTVLPNARHGGWCVPEFNRMDEGRPIALGGGRVLFMIRTCEGHLWTARSEDHGQTWTQPEPSPLIHPDAPPMLFAFSDGQTLAAFHHNRHHDLKYAGLTTENLGMKDRSELWVSLSTDEGRTWSEPRFVLANAAVPQFANDGWRNWQCSYIDAFADAGMLNLFIPHRWQRCLHLQLNESLLAQLPTAKDLG